MQDKPSKLADIEERQNTIGSDMKQEQEIYQEERVDTPASCHECQHWQDGDDGPQCEYPDMPPCRD